MFCRVIVPSVVLLSCLAPSAPLAAQHLDPSLAASIRWYTGVAGHVDNEHAAELLQQAVADEDPISVMWLARVHSTGRMGFDEDPEQARALASSVIATIRDLAENGEIEAMFLMGTAFAEGLGVDRDAVRAVTWYRRAAEAGNVLAQHNMGNVYFAGDGVLQDDAQAVHWWHQAATQGDAIPALRLGTMFEQGRGVDADRDRAIEWYEVAASKGNAEAQEALERLGAE